MAFEELPADYKSFFDTGELPQSMADEQAAAEAARVAQETADAAAAAEAARVAKEASDAAAAAEAARVAAANAPPVTIDPAPQAPTGNPYLERLLADQEAKAALLAQQLDDMKKQVAKLTEVPAPDPQIDPLGYLAHKIDATHKELVALQAAQGKQTQEQQQQNEINSFLNNVNAQVKLFTDTHPDYNDAYQHLAKMRMQDFKDVGMTPDQAKQAFGQEEVGITQRALAMGKNPAEIAYGMATRYGYKAPVATTKTPIDADNKLDVIKKGLEASKDTTHSTPPTVTVDADSLRNMSDKDMQKLVEQDWEKLFGKSKSIFG